MSGKQKGSRGRARENADLHAAVEASEAGQVVGSITPEIAATLRLNKSGAIVLNDSGLQHIEDRHGKEIRGLGFTDARAFVDAVLSDVSAVYDVDGSGRKYDLVSRAMTPQGRGMVRLEFAAAGERKGRLVIVTSSLKCWGFGVAHTDRVRGLCRDCHSDRGSRRRQPGKPAQGLFPYRKSGGRIRIRGFRISHLTA